MNDVRPLAWVRLTPFLARPGFIHLLSAVVLGNGVPLVSDRYHQACTNNYTRTIATMLATFSRPFTLKRDGLAE
ncbi:hypothetical protein C8R44DRAFT_179890 [Mycena epipterygia]|nr:hypothetical protein C8R44DRAFT_179890 [Mycena epipterygia]